MARPRCSRNEPKRLRSKGARVRRESTKTFTTSLGFVVCVWADRKRPNARFAEHAMPTEEACRKKRRRLAENMRVISWECRERANSKRLLGLSQFFSYALSFRRQKLGAKSQPCVAPTFDQIFQLDEAVLEAGPSPEAGVTASADALAACGR